MLSGKIHEIRTFFDLNPDLIRGTVIPGGKNQTKIMELEAKFGYFSPGGFNSTVPFPHYNRLLNEMRSLPDFDPEIIEESHVSQMGNVRKVVTTVPGDGPLQILWERKERIRDIEILEYDIRVSINTEEPISTDEINELENTLDNLRKSRDENERNRVTVRERTRHRFTMKNGLLQLDMTEVMMRREDNVIRSRYEVELEFLGTRNDLAVFEEQIERIFKLLKGTNIVYTNTMKNSLIQDAVKILGGNYNDTIDKNVLVEARNIKKRDLVYGGIVGNQSIANEKLLSIRRPEHKGNGTGYMITFKADGLRKILIIHTTGVWLVFPPFEYNLAVDLTSGIPQLDRLLTGFNGSIFDGELAVPKRPKNTKFWYLATDCLAFRGNSGVQSQPRTENIKIVSGLAGIFKTPILTIDIKESEEIKTPEDFFRLTRYFLNKRDSLEYNQDGLIFIPIDVIYNPKSQNLPLINRTLTRVPDVCKWKDVADITIDFVLKWIDGGKLELYSYDDNTDTLVQFVGDNINVLTSDMIDYTNPLTLGVPAATVVVEYEWVKLPNNNGILRPRRIRHDKRGPNRLSIALDNWEDIMNPITEDDMKGNTLFFTFGYINRLKRGLYKSITKNPNFIQGTKGPRPNKQFIGANILDIGSGRGGDTSKWIGLADKDDPTTGFVVAVEPNPNNRKTLEGRIKRFNLTDKVKIVPTGGEDTVAITNAVRKFIPGGKVDAVTLMLSMSFFWASDSHLEALVNTILTNLKPGGKIVFLTIDGDTVEQIFEPVLGGNHVTDKKILSADIHLYPPPFEEAAGRHLVSLGRPIDFILPDTIVGEQREYIVHLEDFTRRLSVYGINLHEIYRAEGEKLLTKDNALFSSMFSLGYYVNDDKIALTQYEQTTRSPVNTPLSDIPVPIKSPVIQMNTAPTSPVITGTIMSPQIPVIATPVKSPQIPVIATPVKSPQIPVIATPVKSPQIPIVPIPVKSPQIPIVPIPVKSPQILVNLPQIPINIPQMPVIPQLTTIPTKFHIEQNQLRWLSVSYTGKGGTVIKGPAMNDDTYAPLTCLWYENLVRIATIGDGSCFIHAVLKAFYRQYQQNNDAQYRLNMAATVRRDLAIILGLENPAYTGHTYWETSSRGAFPRMVMQQINDEELVGDLRVDYSLSGLQRLFNSTSQLGDEVYTFVSDALNIDIYVLRATRDNLYPHYHTRRTGNLRNGIVVIGNMAHYETLAVDTDDGLQTVFSPGDPFLNALTDLFVGDGDFDDIVNTIPYDPDSSFIQDTVEAFTTPAGFVLPPIITEIFPEKDPFRVTLDRLLPMIENAAEIRVTALQSPQKPRETPVQARLNIILTVMEQSGAPLDTIRHIREIITHRINPDIPQDLDSIIAAAGTDGLLSPEIVDTIRNVETTLE
jgi:SAM-dependent methyltransferase